MDRRYIANLIKELGGKPSPKLVKLLTDSYEVQKDEILKAKLVIAFNASLPVDYIHSLVLTHSFKEIDAVKKRESYHKVGQILKQHFSNQKILQILNSLDEHSYNFYLDTIQEFYVQCCFFLTEEEIKRRMHRSIKSFKKLASMLHEVLHGCLDPDQELQIQRTLFELINNRVLASGHQVYIPVHYDELKKISHFFNNCLGSPLIKKQIDEKNFAIVILKKDNKFIAVSDLRSSLELNEIKAHLNVSINIQENKVIKESWSQQIVPLLIKNSNIF